MLSIYNQQGKLPVWHLVGNETDCMVGYSSVPVLADAFLKGLIQTDPEILLQAMKASAMRDEQGLTYLKQLGYIPADKEKESVSKALEYALADGCIARVAKEMGHMDDYQYFSERALYYMKYFDKQSGFMRAKLSDGSFRTPFDAFKSTHEWGDYTEGNAWQYTWLVPHDVEGLISLFGGEEAFTQKLDSLFLVEGYMGDQASPDISGLIGQYAQGNEPGHHIPYLYAYAGEQWKTARKINKITTEFYHDRPSGLCGNEDCGQMSAWYILSTLGIYQVNPAGGVFVFGSPLFEEVSLQLPGEKQFEIRAKNLSKDNIYIQSASINGIAINRSFITYQEIMKGGILEFSMGAQPNKNFGYPLADRPKSIWDEF
jgi:predicted alpha-1,2-mannosidase